MFETDRNQTHEPTARRNACPGIPQRRPIGVCGSGDATPQRCRGVAYCRLGDLDRSEDIAQQTFVTAWERKFDLDDPARIAAWLCGIARNLVLNQRRRDSREPWVSADASEAVSATSTPEQQATAREEADMLWSVLEKIPETYREPMILFYREDSTTAEVAAALNISEDAVRQRLSRGQKLLEEKVADFVEGTLKKRNTSKDFVGAVMLALPSAGMAPKAATGIFASTAFKPLLAIVGAVGGSLIGIAGGVYGSKRSLDQASSATERSFMWRFIAIVSLLVLALFSVQRWLIFRHRELYATAWVQGLIWGSYAVTLTLTILLGNRRIRQIKLQHGTEEVRRALQSFEAPPISPRAAKWNLVGTVIGSTAWMMIVAAIRRDWLGAALVVISIGVLLAVALPKLAAAETGAQQRSVTLKAAATAFVVMIVVTALRWSEWSSELRVWGMEM